MRPFQRRKPNDDQKRKVANFIYIATVLFGFPMGVILFALIKEAQHGLFWALVFWVIWVLVCAVAHVKAKNIIDRLTWEHIQRTYGEKECDEEQVPGPSSCGSGS